MDIREAKDILTKLGARKIRPHARGFLCSALHRHDDKPSLSVFRAADGGIVVKDHATGEAWSLWSYLTEALGMTKEEAAALLGIERRWEERPRERKMEPVVPVIEFPRPAANPEPLSEEQYRAVEEAWMEALSALGEGDVSYLRERGFESEDAADLGLGITEDGSIVIPIFDQTGKVRNLQIRHRTGETRYSYRFVGHGAGVYLAGEVRAPSILHIVEGPLNAASLAKLRAGGVAEGFVGMPGASGNLPQWVVDLCVAGSFPVLIWTDPDPAGMAARARWAETLYHAGVDRKRILIPADDNLHRDLNDYLAKAKNPMKLLGKRLAVKHIAHAISPGKNIGLAKRIEGFTNKRAIASATGINHVAITRAGRAKLGWTYAAAWGEMEKVLKPVLREMKVDWKQFSAVLPSAVQENRRVKALVNLFISALLEEGKTKSRLYEAAKRMLNKYGLSIKESGFTNGRLVSLKTWAAAVLREMGDLGKAMSALTGLLALLRELFAKERAKFWEAVLEYARATGAPSYILPPGAT